MVGIDIVKVSRIKKIIKNVDRMFFEGEIKYFQEQQNKPEIIAGHYAAKEAIMKVFDCCKNLVFKDIEIYHTENGKPMAKLYNLALDEFNQKNYTQINISISHEDEFAVAIAEVK